MGLEGKHNSQTQLPNILTKPGHRNHRLHLRRNPSRRPPRHILHLRRRFLQAGSRIDIRSYHRQQECMGLWVFEIHYPLDYQIWICTADHDEYESDCSVELLRDYILVLWEDV